jgi:Fic family protein
MFTHLRTQVFRRKQTRWINGEAKTTLSVDEKRRNNLEACYSALKNLPKEDAMTLLYSGKIWMDYSNAFKEPHPDTFPTELLHRIDQKKNIIDKKKPLSTAENEYIWHLFKISLTQNSTALEGNTLANQTETILSKLADQNTEELIEGITEEQITQALGRYASKKDVKEILYHASAMELAKQNSSRKIEEMTEEDIISLHAAVYGRSSSKFITVPYLPFTAYRLLPVNVRGSPTIRPYPWELPEIMGKLLKMIHRGPNSLHPVIFAIRIHHIFLHIHPFSDGNGRTARLLLQIVLHSLGYYGCMFQVTKRNEYLDALQAQQDGNPSQLYQFLGHSRESFYDELIRLRGKPELFKRSV